MTIEEYKKDLKKALYKQYFLMESASNKHDSSYNRGYWEALDWVEAWIEGATNTP